MEEDESFDEFYDKLKDIVNSAFNLGETIPEPKIVRKVLRSLPERFHVKIMTIEESKDIDKIPLTELFGNLQTYELGLTRIGKTSKGKSMALKAKSSDTDESLDDEDFKMKSYITRQFKKISFTETAKEVWTILQTMYEGTKAVEDSKLQRLTTNFEEIKMEEDESFDEFYAKLKDIVNSAFNLGETILEHKIVRKVLKSLLERFHAKITAIEESKNIDKIPLTELVGNLQT